MLQTTQPVADAHAHPAHHHADENYLNHDKRIWSWIYTVDHKRIGLMYLVSTLIAFAMGGAFALLVRLELLYPWPASSLATVLARYGGAELVWCQEEPKNMGAWTYVRDREPLAGQAWASCVSRRAAASPATGSLQKHKAEQADLVARALALGG